MGQVIRVEHECKPKLSAWSWSMLDTKVCAWLVLQNQHLHKCQRCGYIRWRA